MTGNDLRQKGISINLDKERHMIFDLNAFCDLEEKYGDLDKAVASMQKGKMKDIRYFLHIALKHEDESLTEKQVGSLVTLENIAEISKGLNAAFDESVPEAGEAKNG